MCVSDQERVVARCIVPAGLSELSGLAEAVTVHCNLWSLLYACLWPGHPFSSHPDYINCVLGCRAEHFKTKLETMSLFMHFYVTNNCNNKINSERHCVCRNLFPASVICWCCDNLYRTATVSVAKNIWQILHSVVIVSCFSLRGNRNTMQEC